MQTTHPDNESSNFILIFLNADLSGNYILALFFSPAIALSASMAGYHINFLVQRMNIFSLQ